jgi:hypothetical protein
LRRFVKAFLQLSPCPPLSNSIQFHRIRRLLGSFSGVDAPIAGAATSTPAFPRWPPQMKFLKCHMSNMIHIYPVFICVLMSFALFYLCCTDLHLGYLVSKRTKSPRTRLTVHGTYSRITLFRLVEICAALLAQKWQKCTKSAEHCNNSRRKWRRNSRRLSLC